MDETIGRCCVCDLTVATRVTWHFVNRRDNGTPPYQHVLMAETSDQFLLGVARRLALRLVQEEQESWGLLAEIHMAVRLRRAIDWQLNSLITQGTYEDDPEARLAPPKRPTWKEIGEALGVSAQAAHRKYGRPVKR
jgi:hypothetical protein